MTKEHLVRKIIMKLSDDLELFSVAALAAHTAATHEECLPDNKYDTTALEASYIAQGQANRAQEIRAVLESYRALQLHDFDDSAPIRLTALVTVEAVNSNIRRFFIGPYAGGMKIVTDDGEVVVITPGSPLGRSLLGLRTGDEVLAGDNSTLTIIAVR